MERWKKEELCSLWQTYTSAFEFTLANFGVLGSFVCFSTLILHSHPSGLRFQWQVGTLDEWRWRPSHSAWEQTPLSLGRKACDGQAPGTSGSGGYPGPSRPGGGQVRCLLSPCTKESYLGILASILTSPKGRCFNVSFLPRQKLPLPDHSPGEALMWVQTAWSACSWFLAGGDPGSGQMLDPELLSRVTSFSGHVCARVSVGPGAQC